MAFVGGWLVNGLRTPGYDPLSDAISQLAREGAPTRPAMTACFVAFGLLVPLWAPTVARELGVPALRPVVTVAGLATVAVAALPLPADGGSAPHAVAAGAAFLALAAWPVLAARRLAPAPVLSRAVSVAAAAVLLGLVGVFTAELVAGGQRVGTTERAAAAAQAAWPLAVVLGLRGRRDR